MIRDSVKIVSDFSVFGIIISFWRLDSPRLFDVFGGGRIILAVFLVSCKFQKYLRDSMTLLLENIVNSCCE